MKSVESLNAGCTVELSTGLFKNPVIRSTASTAGRLKPVG